MSLIAGRKETQRQGTHSRGGEGGMSRESIGDTYTQGGAVLLSHARLSVTPWTAAHQAPLPTGILQARILEWAAMPSSRGASHQEIEPGSPVLRADSLPAELPGKPIHT